MAAEAVQLVVMRISDYDYELPEERIATAPPAVRGQSRLLVLNRRDGSLQHRRYQDLAEYVSKGDVVVLNDTKVIKARLVATNTLGKQRELLLLEEHGDHALYSRRTLYRGKLRAGETLTVGAAEIKVEEVHDSGIATISSQHNLLEIAQTYGSVPLPPYMHREATQADTERYQTVFAHKEGSVAAPTASLNFTDELARQLEAKGAHIAYLTLHVGLGTFLPIRSDKIEDHTMHSEYFEIPQETVSLIQQAKSEGRKISAVGTTVTRTLEYVGDKLLHSEPAAMTGEANIFIYPGYEFKVVDQLLTNFHAPRSTVLMLAAAFAGWEHLQKAYEEAVHERYNFLSYGDSMLIR